MHALASFRLLGACALVASVVAATGAATGCDTPDTRVVLDNQYPPSTTNALVIFQAFWQAVSFTTAIPPGASSDSQSTVAASANTAYVLLAPGFDPDVDATPTSFVVLQSLTGFGVHFNTTLHIPVDDTTFVGNCAAGSFLTQDQADFITQRVFASTFAGLHYDAATCTTTAGP
jgi:hypothetical protein